MKSAKELFEEAFSKYDKALREGDMSEAPFPMSGEEAEAYLIGCRNTLQWVLEMVD